MRRARRGFQAGRVVLNLKSLTARHDDQCGHGESAGYAPQAGKAGHGRYRLSRAPWGDETGGFSGAAAPAPLVGREGGVLVAAHGRVIPVDAAGRLFGAPSSRTAGSSGRPSQVIKVAGRQLRPHLRVVGLEVADGVGREGFLGVEWRIWWAVLGWLRVCGVRCAVDEHPPLADARRSPLGDLVAGVDPRGEDGLAWSPPRWQFHPDARRGRTHTGIHLNGFRNRPAPSIGWPPRTKESRPQESNLALPAYQAGSVTGWIEWSGGSEGANLRRASPWPRDSSPAPYRSVIPPRLSHVPPKGLEPRSSRT